MPSRCAIEGCRRASCKRGWCGMHYARWKRHGNPEITLRDRQPPTGEVPHGTPHGYNYHRCRCELCAAWRLDYNRARRLLLPDELPAAARKSWLARKYGMTLADYESMLEAQGGVCAICKQPPRGLRDKYLHVDHDHDTGKVRALLCHFCNLGLGHFCDDTVRLLAAADYLLAHQGVSACQ